MSSLRRRRRCERDARSAYGYVSRGFLAWLFPASSASGFSHGQATRRSHGVAWHCLGWRCYRRFRACKQHRAGALRLAPGSRCEQRPLSNSSRRDDWSSTGARAECGLGGWVPAAYNLCARGHVPPGSAAHLGATPQQSHNQKFSGRYRAPLNLRWPACWTLAQKWTCLDSSVARRSQLFAALHWRRRWGRADLLTPSNKS